ncbi:MAG: hypothetical protein LBM96_05930 [Methanobrevibacter sp.]|jgi:hypothetical protein|nr:hypothetical protein [Candidatus Methanoflexus mossambicus]
MKDFDILIKKLEKQRSNAENGIYNCIPFPFERFRNKYPGTEKGKYIILTANQKIGKSKLADFLYVYDPLFLAIENKIKVNILYYTLEMSIEEKNLAFFSYLLYKLDNKLISVSDLKSTNHENPLNEEIINLLKSEKYQKYINFYFENVEYVTNETNPTGIYKYCKKYAEKYGQIIKEEKVYKNIDKETGEEIEKKYTKNIYIPNNENYYTLVIIDNAANITSEKGYDTKGTIDKMSKYFIELKNTYNFTFVLIQHQMQAQESIDNIKANRISPTTQGLGDAKTTSRDATQIIGLYSPYKYKIKEFLNYDITKFKDNIRFLEILEDRDYGSNLSVCPLFFEGKSGFFKQLPNPNDKEKIEATYKYLEKIRNEKPTSTNTVKSFFIKLINNDNNT